MKLYVKIMQMLCNIRKIISFNTQDLRQTVIKVSNSVKTGINAFKKKQRIDTNNRLGMNKHDIKFVLEL